jgi:hypothetical protein
VNIGPRNPPLWFSDTGRSMSTPQGVQTFHIRHQEGAWPPSNHPDMEPAPTPSSRLRQRAASALLRARGQVTVGWNIRLDVVAGKGVIKPELLFATPTQTPVGGPGGAGSGRGTLPMTVAHLYEFTARGARPGDTSSTEPLPAEVAAATGIEVDAGEGLSDHLETVRLTDMGTLALTASVGTYQWGNLRLSRRLPGNNDRREQAQPARRLIISTHGATQRATVPLPDGIPLTFLGPNELILSGQKDFLETGSFYAQLERTPDGVTVTSGANGALAASVKGNLYHMAGSAIPGRVADLSLTPYGTPDDHHWKLQRNTIGTHALTIAGQYGDIDIVTLAPGTQATLSQVVRDVTRTFGMDYAEIIVFACRGDSQAEADLKDIHQHDRNWSAEERPMVRTHFSRDAGNARPVPTLQDSPAKLLDAVLGKVGQRGQPPIGLTLPELASISSRSAMAAAIQTRLAGQGVHPADHHAEPVARFVDRLCDDPAHAASSLQHVADIVGDSLSSWLFAQVVLQDGRHPGLEARIDAFLAALPDISPRGRASLDQSRWVPAMLELIQSPDLSSAQRQALLHAQTDVLPSWIAYAVAFPGRSTGIADLGSVLARLPLSDAERHEVLMMRRGDEPPALLHAVSKADDDGTRTPYAQSIRIYDAILATSGLTPDAQAAVVTEALSWRSPGGASPLAAAARPAPADEGNEEAIHEAQAALKNLLDRLPFTTDQQARIDTAAGRHPFFEGTSRIFLEPPLAVQADIVRHPRPYRPLPPATGPMDGKFLTPRVQNYQANDEFTRRMAAAGEEAVTTFAGIRASRDITPADIEAVLHRLGDARRAIAHELAPDDSPELFGRPVEPGSHMADEILDEPGHRHAAYGDRAIHWADSMNDVLRDADPEKQALWEARKFEIEVDGKRHRVAPSSPIINSERNGARIFHPTDADARLMHQCAYTLLAEALNRRDLSEEQTMFRLGKAYFLLSHGLPLQRGTPSCVEPMIDAILRVTHGVTLPPKREGIEPVWEAIFTGGSNIDVFAHNFRHLFE